MFRPPHCPVRECPRHLDPGPAFFHRKGSYHPKCRDHPVPRFLCMTCGKSFSRQTFRQDYRDHKPHLNPLLFQLVTSGVGLRQSARVLRMTLRCTELKFRKIARQLQHANSNLPDALPEGSTLQFDELETYEGRRNTRPLTVPVLIDRGTRFVLWAESAPIRPRGRMSKARERAIAEDEKRYGKRRNESVRAIRSTLAKGREMTAEHETVYFSSDEKTLYPSLARQAFGKERLVHEQTNSKLPRTPWNPLFAINNTEAMARDLLGRLRRESWLVSKKGWCLDLGLHCFIAYRNYVRLRFNRDRESPAQKLGFVERPMRPTELLSWRQDFGRERSIHPLARGSESVADYLSARRAA